MSSQARQQRAAEEATREAERAEQRARELNEQIRVDALRQQMVKEQQYRARKRANSEATEVPASWDTLTETFHEEIDVNGVRFNTVKIFYPRTGVSPRFY